MLRSHRCNPVTVNRHATAGSSLLCERADSVACDGVVCCARGQHKLWAWCAARIIHALRNGDTVLMRARFVNESTHWNL